MKKISIIGSTGSIGTQTLEVVRASDDMQVVALSCGRNVTLLEQQIREFRPRLVSVSDESAAINLKARISDVTALGGGSVRVVYGMDGLIEVAAYPDANITVTAVVGMIGVRPTLAAIEAGHDIALANKETLVTAGHLVMKAAADRGVKILPVDSEHSAIFQSLQGMACAGRGVYVCEGSTGDSCDAITGGDAAEGSGAGTVGGVNPACTDLSDLAYSLYLENRKRISRILLTASGGPFRGRSRRELESVTVEQALKHPNWSMGHKITIDSATMMNKGLEVIEAHWLFDMPVDRIEVLVQPQSIIHSAVEYTDGAVIAQLGTPDMKLPIQYALTYPERRYLAGDRLSFKDLAAIYIETPDREKFKGLDIAARASQLGGNMPTVMNAANEYAVDRFLTGHIGFLDIYDYIEYAMDSVAYRDNPSLEEILETEQETYDVLRHRDI